MKEILESHKLWLDTYGKKGVKAELRGADLQGAILQGADLQGADRRGAVLRGADLQGADLQGAILQDAILRGADLQGADLRNTSLRGASLQGADIDFSAWPLWCGSKDVKIDERQAIQLFSHVFNVGLKYWPGGLTDEQIDFINRFHQPGFKVKK